MEPQSAQMRWHGPVLLASLLVSLTLVLSPAAALANEDAVEPQSLEATELEDMETPSEGLEEHDAAEKTEDATAVEGDAPVAEPPAAQDPKKEDTPAPNVVTDEATEETIDAEVQAPTVSGEAYVQRQGWVGGKASSAGIMLGTTGRALRLEALKLRVSGGSISYKAHVQRVGWTNWVSDDAVAGTEGRALRTEALRIRLEGELADSYSIQYRVHVQGIGWMGWAQDGSPAGTTGMARRVEAVELRIVAKGTALPTGGGAAYRDAGMSGSAHVQKVGWQASTSGYNITLGTMGRSLRLEALKLGRPGVDASGELRYSAHVQSIGWQGWRSGNQVVGTTGQAKRVEALKVELTGELATLYDVWYRVHAQGAGWMGWASNGAPAGTAGLALRAEAIQIVLVGKGQGAPSSAGQNMTYAYVAVPSASYRVSQGGWQAWRGDGAACGNASGAGIRGFDAKLSDTEGINVSYAAYMAKGSWTGWTSSGTQVGDGSQDIHAIRMKLDGPKARLLSLWYRAYVKGVGWTSWAKNGQEAGSIGHGAPITAVQVRVLAYNGSAPGNGDAALGVTCAGTGFAQLTAQANATQQRLLSSAQSTGWPGPGLCAAWVENVYRNAGVSNADGNANDLYYRYCHSSNVADLKVGMIIAVSRHSKTTLGGIYGHVGIYVGNGWVMHSVNGGVTKVPLSYWINYYGDTVTPKWGWLGNARVA